MRYLPLYCSCGFSASLAIAIACQISYIFSFWCFHICSMNNVTKYVNKALPGRPEYRPGRKFIAEHPHLFWTLVCEANHLWSVASCFKLTCHRSKWPACSRPSQTPNTAKNMFHCLPTCSHHLFSTVGGMKMSESRIKQVNWGMHLYIEFSQRIPASPKTYQNHKYICVCHILLILGCVLEGKSIIIIPPTAV